MKKCLNCNIEIGGRVDTCPLCQNRLSGDASPDNWPAPTGLKAKAFLYKLQLFIALALVAVDISLDYLLGINNGIHHSPIIALWIIIFEMDLRSNIKRIFVLSRVVSISILHISILLLITAWYFNFFDVIAYMVIPILLGTALLANLTFTMLDSTENALVYLLGNIFVIIVVYVSIKARQSYTGLTWDICLMLSMVALIFIIIFKGRRVLGEIQRRMNF